MGPTAEDKLLSREMSRRIGLPISTVSTRTPPGPFQPDSTLCQEPDIPQKGDIL